MEIMKAYCSRFIFANAFIKAVVFISLQALTANAQVATSATITSLTTSTLTSSSTSVTVPGAGSTSFPAANSYNLVYQGESAKITSFTTGTGSGTVTYSPINYTGTITTSLVRVSSPLGTNQDNNLIYQRRTNGGINPYSLAGPLDSNQQSAFNSNNLNLGTDNLFGNTGDGSGNNNNVERVDVVFDLGLTVTDALAFIVLERGVTNAHDGFKIAAITAIDGSGNPTAFGSVVTFASGSYGDTDLLPDTTDWLVLRNNASNPGGGAVSPSAAVNNQPIGGTTIAASASASNKGLGMTTGSTIYGYSLFATDVTGSSSAELLNVTDNTFYPKNTPSNTGAGGIDLVAYTGVAVQVIPEPGILGFFALAALWQVCCRRHYKL